MEDSSHRAIAIVGVSAILPDAPNALQFWHNIKNRHYSISEVPAGRWDLASYYDPDPRAPDKTYSKIGGWVQDWQWDPFSWHLPIPPKVAASMDDAQKWAVAGAHAVLLDYGDSERPLDRERTAVILGNAMGGELHYMTSLRIYFPEYARALAQAPSFSSLPGDVQRAIEQQMHERMTATLPLATEDTMPGELSNCMAGRVANLFDFKGPNYVCDAACASALAALDAACEGLIGKEYDAAFVGGIDRNMGAPTYVKFCKIGALSATGTRPYADGADGFVMGEGAAFFLLKRLADAERNGDRIYAVLRGIGGSSDGKGKGITAPNPIGQQLALQRAWHNAGVSPDSVGLIEGHGTSTRVGDVVEVNSLIKMFGSSGLAPGSVALGSVKSNIGHLKSGAGAAGLLKAMYSLHHQVLPPSLNFKQANPNIDFANSPFYVNTELRPWQKPNNSDGVRRAGVSAFGFGGTNFHVVLEEYVPGRLSPRKAFISAASSQPQTAVTNARSVKSPLQGSLVLGAATAEQLRQRLEHVLQARQFPDVGTAPAASDLAASERLVIAYQDKSQLETRLHRAEQAFKADQASLWRALQSQGVYRGCGAAAKVAFLYTGQGSQYANMLAKLRLREPIVADTFAEADRIMKPLLDRPLSSYLFVDPDDSVGLKQAEAELRRTEITQPAVLAVDTALTRLFASYGIAPDMVMGHSLGEYGALVAAGSLSFANALEAVSARGREMTRVSLDDNGLMAAVFAPLEQISEVVAGIQGNVVIANINSNSQAVIGGASDAVEQAMAQFREMGVNVAQLPVSHAFHTSIVAPASEPLRQVLERMQLKPPAIPLVANVTGEFYPPAAGMLDMLSQQVASPVQFVKGLNTLYQAGARVLVEVGPKTALKGFADDVLGGHEDVMTLFTNHPKVGESASFNQALCGLYAAGVGVGEEAVQVAVARDSVSPPAANITAQASAEPTPVTAQSGVTAGPRQPLGADRYQQLGHMFADFLEQGLQVVRGEGVAKLTPAPVITGAALGIPGTERIFDDSNVQRILDGEQQIDVIPARFRHAMVDKHITRLVKTGDGDPHFEAIDSAADVIKLAGRGGAFDLQREFGVPADRIPALDITTRLAMAAGIDALRDAGIPLVMRYRTTHKGTKLPERWMLPETMRDDTGVIFAAAFPGLDSFADELTRYQVEHGRQTQHDTLVSLREYLAAQNSGTSVVAAELERRIHEIEQQLQQQPYNFDRRFLFKCLAMGHSQMAEYIGARGPNTHINSACASTTQAFAVAEDWIAAGRCRRVLIIAADDVTSDHLLEWMGSGFLASGAAATDEVVEDAALPFDRRRHGMILGMGACGIVVEAPECAAQRGLRPICELLSTVTANSAFHGTRLDIEHICTVMEQVVRQAEQRFGLDRHQLASELMFVSHETYTPARGGSASAEVQALRRTFGDSADRIVIANTKGLTGHAMGVGIEDTIAIKALETGIVPPVANFEQQDPELGPLNLSKGGVHPIRYALRLGAGFGSQISLSLMRWVPTADGTRPNADELGYNSRIERQADWQNWLRQASGSDAPELEVVQRTLRVKQSDTGKGAKAADYRPQPAVASVKSSSTVTVESAAASLDPAPPEAAQTHSDPIAEQVLAVVAGITGYASDMLEMDLDLEADLGIDTVKQAETFAAIREHYDIPRDENLKLRDYPSIAHAVQFVKERRPDLAVPGTQDSSSDSNVHSQQGISAADDGIASQVLAVVAGITGYPSDMLDLDLDLEADLGIDTVKQAETFAAIREHYDIPRDENLKLRDYPSIAHAIEFVRERRPDLVSAVAASLESAPAATAALATDDGVTAQVLAVVAGITGYPSDMLDLDLDLEADLGIDTVKQAETFAAIREHYDIPRDENLKLRDYPSIAHAIEFVRERRPDLVSAVAAPLESAPAATAALAADDGVTAQVLAVVSQITGYPPDMLDLDLDLEADLGIDTVKQAETFAAIREHYDIPRDENLKLRDYPSIAHAIEFVRERRPDLAAAVAASLESAPAAPAALATDDGVTAQVLAVVSQITGYPPDMLDLDLDLEADLGIDTVKQAETFAAIREHYDIPRDENLKLRDYPSIAHAIEFVRERRPDLAAVVATPDAPEPAMAREGTPESQDEAITAQVMAVVSDITGYPTDMLDLDLDLEADLGIDTVKQAETFGAIREHYDIPRDENLKLRDYPTIAHAVEFVKQRRPQRAEVPQADSGEQPQSPANEPTGAQGEAGASTVIPRRIPTPVLRPPLGLCKATGVALGPDSRVLLMSDAGGVGKALVTRLQKLGVEVLLPDPGLGRSDFEAQLQQWLEQGPVHGVYWLPALDAGGELADIDLGSWREAMETRVKLLFVAMRCLYQQIANRGTFLVAATRLGGKHGYDQAGAVAPMGGAVSGFTKSYSRERPDALVKVVDFAASRKTAALADTLLQETLADPGAVEIGIVDDQRWTVGLTEQVANAEATAIALNADTVFAITGAAGSIVSAITADLAAASGGIFYLLDMAPIPDADNADIRRVFDDRDALKRELFERLKAGGERATPAIVEGQLAILERLNSALAAIEAVQDAGGTACYIQLDLTDSDAVAEAIDIIRREQGRIDVLLHAAGIERSHSLPDKSQQEFDLVFDVKCDGWFNLLHSIADMPLAATVVFSSIAGRFGNMAQTDYSAANDLLCKYTSAMARTHRNTRAIAIDWTAWASIGMASRGSIPEMMALAGIDMLAPELGIPVIRRELSEVNGRGEIVIADRLGVLMQERDASGGLDIEALTEHCQHPMLGQLVTMGPYRGLRVDTLLDPTEQPFLFDHQIEGTPVLPGVMALEAFAELAQLLFPELQIRSLEDIEFMAPMKFYRQQSQTLELRADFGMEGDEVLVHCLCASSRLLHAQDQAQVTTHFSATVRLGSEALAAAKGSLPEASSTSVVTAKDLYSIYFHGAAYQVLQQAWLAGNQVVASMAENLPCNHLPEDSPLVLRPRLIELCFQAAGAWQIGTSGKMALPRRIARITLPQAGAAAQTGTIHGIVSPRGEDTFDAEVIDGLGQVLLRLEGYQSIEYPSPIEETLRLPLVTAMTREG